MKAGRISKEEKGGRECPETILRNKLGRRFSIFLAMSDTQEFLFLDSALLKQTVDMKKMKNLKKKVEWKVIEIMEGGMETGWGGMQDRQD